MNATARQTALDVALIVVAVLLVRLATFWSEVIDWDVGLYLTVAREALHGTLPYVSAWEFRPPGLFFLLAAGLAVFRTPMATMAVFGVVAVAATSLGLYRLGRAFEGGGRAIGIVAALLYATISIENDGLATNSEILFAPLICWAVVLVVLARLDSIPFFAGRCISIGVLLGAALQMKLMVLPEAAFVVALAIWWAQAGPAAGALIAGVAFLPFVFEAVLYDAHDQLTAFLDANVLATLRRSAVATTAPRDNLAHILAQPYALFPAWLLAAVVPFVRPRSGEAPRVRAILRVAAVWLAVEAATILGVREFNDHQFLQLLPPLALLAAFATVALGARMRRAGVAVTAVLVVAFALHGYFQIVTGVRLAYHRAIRHDAAWHEANVDRIAARIAAAPAKARTLFVVGETPIVYVLANTELTTRFPFSLYLTDREMWPLTGVDGRQEVARILAERPAFILRSDSQFHVDPYVDAEIAAALRQDYDLVDTYEHDGLYQRHDLRARP